MTLMDIRSLLTLLEAIEHVCTYEKGKLDSFEKSDKSSNKGKKGKKCPDTNSTARVPKKVSFEKHCNLCKKHGGTHTTHNTRDCRRFERTERRNPVSAPPRKGDTRVIL